MREENISEDEFCVICGDEFLVWVGEDKKPLCATHFNEYLAGIRETIDRLKA